MKKVNLIIISAFLSFSFAWSALAATDVKLGFVDMKKAVQTGSISSEESLAVISSLEGCYKSLNIPFHPPVRK